MEQKKSQLNNYAELNLTAKPGQNVVFGSTYAASLALSELAADNDIQEKVYNRSISGLKVDDAKDYISICVCDLSPMKLFINIGDEDIKSPLFDVKHFSEAYSGLVSRLEKALPQTKIYLVSVFGSGRACDELNRFIERLSEKRGHVFIDISVYTAVHGNANLKVFNAISRFFRLAPMSFADAMRR